MLPERYDIPEAFVWRCSVKKVFLNFFAIFTGKHVLDFLFNKDACQGVRNVLVFRKICVRIKWVIPNEVFIHDVLVRVSLKQILFVSANQFCIFKSSPPIGVLRKKPFL